MANHLYYQRRKLAKNNSPVFHGIKVSEKDFTFQGGAADKPSLKENAHIKIEIVLYEIVKSEDSDVISGKISIDSPIGQGLIGAEEGDMCNINTPNGIIK